MPSVFLIDEKVPLLHRQTHTNSSHSSRPIGECVICQMSALNGEQSKWIFFANVIVDEVNKNRVVQNQMIVYSWKEKKSSILT